MKIYQGLETFVPPAFSVVTSGTFDGVHAGHQKILGRVRELANAKGGETVLLTFWPHPRMVVAPERMHELQLLSTLEEKAELLERFGIDHLVVQPFDQAFSQWSPRQYVDEILIKGLWTKYLVIGYDHRFGRERAGGIEYLLEHAEDFGFEVEEIPRQDIDDIAISSTKIRQALQSGLIRQAGQMLGHPYSLRGLVVQGQQLGRTIGFPTANIAVETPYKLIPANGTYAVWAVCENTRYPAMLHIGIRPTVAEGLSRSIEVHLIEFEGNLYEKEIKIEFIAQLRGEIKFDGLEALQQQLCADRQAALQALDHS